VRFQLVETGFEQEEGAVVEALVLSFEIHQGLPCDCDVKIVEGDERLFEYVPIRLQGLVAEDCRPLRTGCHNTNDAWVAMEDRNRRVKDGLVLKNREVMKKP
jgi:hypothetical protein